MGKLEKLKAKLMAKQGYNNFLFGDIQTVLDGIGFTHARTNGSHAIYHHPSIPEPVNIQSVNGKCKAYQLNQIRKIIEEYKL